MCNPGREWERSQGHASPVQSSLVLADVSDHGAARHCRLLLQPKQLFSLLIVEAGGFVLAERPTDLRRAMQGSAAWANVSKEALCAMSIPR